LGLALSQNNTTSRPAPTSVGPDTSLILEELRREYSRYKVSLEVDFRTLVGWKKLGDQLTHQLHPYPAKLLPQIAAFFLQASVLTKGRSVLDPFCGSGTVALEASISGLAPFVADANPLALLLTTVKTTPYAIDDLLHEAAGILSRGKRYRTAPEVPIVNADIWYSDSTKRNLERLLRAIRDIEDTSVRSFFEVCFSVAARRLSYADPAISVPVRQRCKSSLGGPTNARIAARLQWLENADEFEEFASVCLINIERVLHTNASNPNRVAATPVGTDARQLGPRPDAPDTEYSLVLTSPPYGSAQKYVRASSLTLNWLGLASPSELSRLEAKSIGREHLPAHAPSHYFQERRAASQNHSHLFSRTLVLIARDRASHRIRRISDLCRRQ
jgi:hypothetical protein